MKLNRLLLRFIYHFFRKVIVLISYLNHRIHTSLFAKLLKVYGMKINGAPRYIGSRVKFDDIDKIELGNRVVISDRCEFLTHDYSFTTALLAIGKLPSTDISLLGSIKVGNNVFIGTKSIIMPNTIIGENVIIGAGSVVRGKLDSNSVYIGNPCVKIKTIKEIVKKWDSKNLETKKDKS